ncbi:hypothetical protein ACHAPJ_010699 [Fusarium lateritium]
MTLKPITLWAHNSGPNAWKVALVLEELDVPYNVKFIDFPDMKKQPFVSINPNGRVPAIEDPNTSTTLWESGAILEYLTETYDSQHKISFTAGSKEFYEARQWLFYQVSSQGPYFGQAMWFTVYHTEKLPSVIDRYVSEINRVSSVLDGVLQQKAFLVDDKFSYADASFVMWYVIMGLFADKVNLEKDCPFVQAWLQRMNARPSVKKVLKDREVAMGAK